MNNLTPTKVEAGWSLDPRLADDTVKLCDLPLSRVLLSKDASFPWLLLVPRRLDIVELIDLDDDDRVQLLDEITQVAGAVRKVTRCDKLNIAALGNVVAQLHVHVIARRVGDAAWPRPVWGAVPAQTYAPEALERLIADLRRELG